MCAYLCSDSFSQESTVVSVTCLGMCACFVKEYVVVSISGFTHWLSHPSIICSRFPYIDQTDQIRLVRLVLWAEVLWKWKNIISVEHALNTPLDQQTFWTCIHCPTPLSPNDIAIINALLVDDICIHSYVTTPVSKKVFGDFFIFIFWCLH